MGGCGEDQSSNTMSDGEIYADANASECQNSLS